MHSIPVNTYKQMFWWRDCFFSQNGPILMVVVGSPGVSKSHMFREKLPPGGLYASGSLSCVHFYTQLYEHRDEIVVVDDVDALFSDASAVNLLKCLGNTDHERTVFWGKQNHQLDALGIPKQFTTTSRVVILANTLKSIEANLAAVLDRAIVISFQPGPAEIHHETARWFQNKEVYNFIGANLHRIPEHSMRWYRKADDVYRVGGDWRSLLLCAWHPKDAKLSLVAEILQDEALATSEARVRRFQELGGGSRATFMRKLAKWREVHAGIR